MTIKVSISRFRASMARMMRRVEKGDRIILTDRGRPCGQISPPPEPERLWKALNVRPAKHRRPRAISPIRFEGDPVRELMKERRRDASY